MVLSSQKGCHRRLITHWTTIHNTTFLGNTCGNCSATGRSDIFKAYPHLRSQNVNTLVPGRCGDDYKSMMSLSLNSLRNWVNARECQRTSLLRSQHWFRWQTMAILSRPHCINHETCQPLMLFWSTVLSRYLPNFSLVEANGSFFFRMWNQIELPLVGWVPDIRITQLYDIHKNILYCKYRCYVVKHAFLWC